MVRNALNFRTSYQKLWLILEATFDPNRDLFVTLTYRDADLPKRREDADRRLSYFLRALREYRKAEGQELVYVRTTEGFHTGGRFHHHLFINGTGNDYAIIRQLWKSNADQVEILPFKCKTAWDHAQYVTKEPREKGRRHVGDRTWRASRNVKRPVVVSEEDVEAGSILQAPPGAWVRERDTKDNSFGRFQYLDCRISDEQLNTNSGSK